MAAAQLPADPRCEAPGFCHMAWITFFKRLGRRASPNCTVSNSVSIQLNSGPFLLRTKLPTEVRTQGVNPNLFDRQRRGPASQMGSFLAPALRLSDVNPIGHALIVSCNASIDDALHQHLFTPIYA